MLQLARDYLAGKPLARRSARWPVVRAEWLRDHPVCAACGGSEHLNVHHIQPYHLFPERELDLHNLVTLCERPTWNCHLIVGHCGNWRDYRRDVLESAGVVRDGLGFP